MALFLVVQHTVQIWMIAANMLNYVELAVADRQQKVDFQWGS
jgi:hypothetical protein